MKKFSSIFVLAVGFILLSATPAKNSADMSSRNGDLVIRINPATPKVAEQIYFSVNDYSKSKTFYWTFGDGTDRVVTTGPSASHTYSEPGTYRVKVSSGDQVAVEMVMIAN